MDTFGYRITDHSTLNEEVVVCGTQLLRINETPAPVHHSVVMHAVSGDVLGWHLFDRCACYQSLQHAIHASLTKGRRCREPGPCYIVDAGFDAKRIAQTLNDIGIDVRLYSSMSHEQSAQVEWSFRDFNRTFTDGLMTDDRNLAKVIPLTVATLRIRFKKWLKIYQQRPPLRQPPAEACPSKVTPPPLATGAKTESSEFHAHPINHKHTLRQSDQQRGRSSQDDHHFK